jgi:VWFA-related protein
VKPVEPGRATAPVIPGRCAVLRADAPRSRRGPLRGPATACLLAALLLAAPSAAWTQQPAPDPVREFGETLDVDVVLLDVVAVDREGRLVTDLTADEIEVREDGRTVPLESFEPPPPTPARTGTPAPRRPAPEAPAAPRTPPASPDRDRHLVIFVDNAHISGSNRDRFVQELWTFLNEDVPPGTDVMVASNGSGLSLLTGFTEDREEIREALLTALREPALGSLAEREQREGIRVIQQRQRDAIEVSRDTPCGPNLGAMALSFASAAHDRTASAIHNLRFLVATLGGIDGSKALVHVSNGVPLVPGQPVVDYTISLCDGSGNQEGVSFALDAMSDSRRAGMLNPSSLRMDLQRFSVHDDLRRVTELATANRVRMFTIQVAPPPAGGAEAAEGLDKVRTGASRFLENRNSEDSLFFMAEETGGRAFLSGTGFDRDLDRVQEQVSGSYSLSYVAPGGRDGASHRIEVRTTRPGVRILAPSSRTSKTRVDEVNDRLLAALHHGVTRHPDGAGITLTSATEGGTPTRVRLLLPTAEITIPDGHGGRQGLLNVYLTARSETGVSIGLRHKLHPVTLPPDAPVPPMVSLEIELGADLGGHDVAVAIHDQIQGTVWTLLESHEPAVKTAGGPSVR